MDRTVVDEKLRSHALFVGRWSSGAAGDGGTPGHGWRTVEWHAGGAHLVQWRTGGPSGPSGIGCTAAEGTYVQVYSDDGGACRIYALTVEDDVCRVGRVEAPFGAWFTVTVDVAVISSG